MRTFYLRKKNLKYNKLLILFGSKILALIGRSYIFLWLTKIEGPIKMCSNNLKSRRKLKMGRSKKNSNNLSKRKDIRQYWVAKCSLGCQAFLMKRILLIRSLRQSKKLKRPVMGRIAHVTTSLLSMSKGKKSRRSQKQSSQNKKIVNRQKNHPIYSQILVIQTTDGLQQKSARKKERKSQS